MIKQLHTLLILPLLTVLLSVNVFPVYAAEASHAAQTQQLRIQDVIKRADTMITTRITSLNTLLSRLQSDTKLTTDEKTSLVTSIQTTITDLTNLKTKIDADTDVTTARNDAKQIVTNYYVYETFEPKIRLLIILNNLQTNVLHLQALVPQLQKLVDTLQSQGKDVSAVTPLMTDITVQIQTINTTITNDITTLQNLSASTNAKTTITQVHQDITTILHTDFGKIRTDMYQIRVILEKLIFPNHLITPSHTSAGLTGSSSANITK